MKKLLSILFISFFISLVVYGQFDKLKKTIKSESENIKNTTTERGKHEAKKKVSKEIDKQVNKLKK